MNSATPISAKEKNINQHNNGCHSNKSDQKHFSIYLQRADYEEKQWK